MNAMFSMSADLQRRPIMITGASGFVGWNATRFFARRRHGVIATFGSYPHYLHDDDDVRTVQMDLLDDTSVERTVSHFQPRCILHCAALARPQRDKDTIELMRVNVDGTASLARHAARYDIPILYLSTDLVYPLDAGMVTDSTPTDPPTLYGRSKLLAEHALQASNENWVVLRPSIMYGDGVPRSNSFSQFLDRHWSKGEAAPVFTDQFRSFLFVLDLLAAVDLLMRRPDAWRSVYLCGGPERLSRHEFALRYARQRGIDERLVRPMRAEELEGYVGGASNIELDSRPMLHLGWKQHSIEESVPTMQPIPLRQPHDLDEQK